jgi:hypothetical protein
MNAEVDDREREHGIVKDVLLPVLLPFIIHGSAFIVGLS